MSMGGCIDLVERPLCGKLKWLKNLSISEGMLRSFNSSMVIVLDGTHVSYVIETRNSITCGSMYFVLGGVSPGRELLMAPG